MEFNHVTLTADLLADEEYGPRWHAAAILIDGDGKRHEGTAADAKLRLALLAAIQVAQGGADIWHERIVGISPRLDPQFRVERLKQGSWTQLDPSAAIKAAQDTLATITRQANEAISQAAGEVSTEQKLQDQATAATEEAFSWGARDRLPPSPPPAPAGPSDAWADGVVAVLLSSGEWVGCDGTLTAVPIEETPDYHYGWVSWTRTDESVDVFTVRGDMIVALRRDVARRQ